MKCRLLNLKSFGSRSKVKDIQTVYVKITTIKKEEKKTELKKPYKMSCRNSEELEQTDFFPRSLVRGFALNSMCAYIDDPDQPALPQNLVKAFQRSLVRAFAFRFFRF